jgi:MYXO-CTERM domain-containing protein
MLNYNRINRGIGAGVLAICVASICTGSDAVGAQLVSYDAVAAGAGVTPAGVGWSQFGTAMTNNGVFLLQDNTANDPLTESGEYLSTSVPAGTMSRTSGAYGIEFTVRPQTDTPFLGGSHFANAYVLWSDDEFSFNVTIDMDTDDGGAGTTGGIKFGENTMGDAITGIDWSTPHTIFIGYDSALEVHNFYLDDVYQSTLTYGNFSRNGVGYAQDAVGFGDGTSGQGIDVAIEWYNVSIYDVNDPNEVVPPLVGDINGDGFVGIADLNLVLGNCNAGTPPTTGNATIPEPATLTLLGLGGLAMLRRR